MFMGLISYKKYSDIDGALWLVMYHSTRIWLHSHFSSQRIVATMGFIRRLFGGQKVSPVPSGIMSMPSQFGVALDSRLPEATPSDLTRRELVRVAVHDVCRAHGVPAPWIECEALAIHSRTGEMRMFVRLKVVHWDERLLKYALAFQRHLRSEVIRRDPRAADWLMGIGWELVSEANCPYLAMPRPATWMAFAPVSHAAPVVHAAAAPKTASVDVLDRRSRPRDGDMSQRKPAISNPASLSPASLSPASLSPASPSPAVPKPAGRPTPTEEDFPETRQGEL